MMSSAKKYVVTRETIVTIESDKFMAQMNRQGQLFLSTKLPLFRISHINMQDKRGVSVDDVCELAEFIRRAAELNKAEFAKDAEE